MGKPSRNLGALSLLSLCGVLAGCGSPGAFTVAVESKEKCMLSMTKDGKVLFENLPFVESYTGALLSLDGVMSLTLQVECLDGMKWNRSFDRAAELGSRTIIFRADGTSQVVDP